MELERDVYNKDCLMIPMLEDGRGPADEEDEISKFPPKASKHCKQNLSLSGQIPIRPTVAGIYLPYFYTETLFDPYHVKKQNSALKTHFGPIQFGQVQNSF